MCFYNVLQCANCCCRYKSYDNRVDVGNMEICILYILQIRSPTTTNKYNMYRIATARERFRYREMFRW